MILFCIRFLSQISFIVCCVFSVTIMGTGDAKASQFCAQIFYNSGQSKPLLKNEIYAFLKNLGLKTSTSPSMRSGILSFGRFRFFQSKTAKLLSDFNKKWGIEIYFDNSPIRPFSWSSIINGQQMTGLYIPIEKLGDAIYLKTLIEQLDLGLSSAKRLQDLGAKAHITFYDETLQVHIVNAGNSKDPFLRWIENRIRRHGITFSFYRAGYDSGLVHSAGYATGSDIVIRQEYVSSKSEQWLTDFGVGVVAHEITHATNFAKFANNGTNVEQNISFYALESGSLTSHRSYKKFFGADELEAYHVSHLWDRRTDVTAKLFLPQKDWLRAAQKLLHSEGLQNVVVDENHYALSIQHENLKVEIQIPYNELSQKDLAAQEYIESVIARRIQQVENIEKIILK